MDANATHLMAAAGAQAAGSGTPSSSSAPKPKSKSKSKSKSKGTSTAATPSAAGASTKTASATSTTKKTKPRKKKTNSKSKSKSGASSASNQVLSAAALTKKAKALFEKLQHEHQVSFHDKAWLASSSPPLQLLNNVSNGVNGVNGTSAAKGSGSFLDSELDMVQHALKANGLSPSDITAEAFGCLLESGRKYALELIEDATDYSMISSTDELTPADLTLAQEMMQGDDNDSLWNKGSCRNSPHKLHALSVMADEVNRRILPPIPDECYNGLVLPPPQHNLLGRTFDVVTTTNTTNTTNTCSTTTGTTLVAAANTNTNNHGN